MECKESYLRAYILCVNIETSSLWAEFVKKNRVISVRLVSEYPNFDNSHNSFLWPEYFIDYFMWKMDPMSGFDICLVFTLRPETVNCSTKDVYTSEKFFLALHPWLRYSSKMWIKIVLCVIIRYIGFKPFYYFLCIIFTTYFEIFWYLNVKIWNMVRVYTIIRSLYIGAHVM